MNLVVSTLAQCIPTCLAMHVLSFVEDRWTDYTFVVQSRTGSGVFTNLCQLHFSIDGHITRFLQAQACTYRCEVSIRDLLRISNPRNALPMLSVTHDGEIYFRDSARFDIISLLWIPQRIDHYYYMHRVTLFTMENDCVRTVGEFDVLSADFHMLRIGRKITKALRPFMPAYDPDTVVQSCVRLEEIPRPISRSFRVTKSIL